jgi:aldehyde dehydrogenase (NAD+)
MTTTTYLAPDPTLWINGEAELGHGSPFQLVNPATGGITHTYAGGTPNQVNAAVNTAARVFPVWAALDSLRRSALLHVLSEALQSHGEELAYVESSTTGKPIRDCHVEVAKCAEIFLHYAGVPGQLFGQTVPLPRPWFAFTERVPLGVIAIFTPWNAPLFTACWNIAAALACGNTVVLKPSEFTPLSSLALLRILEDAGLPPGVVNIVIGDGVETGSALVTAPGVAKIAFIGSVAVGRIVGAAAATVGVPSVLELGGKSANIVFADADLEAAARGAVTALYSNNGQSCTAGSRLLVEDTVFDELVARVAELTGRLRVGAPTDPDTELGPINNQRQWERIHESIAAGVDRGARIYSHRDVEPNLPSGGFWLMPTVLGDSNSENPIFTTEIFGPVLAVSSFASESEALTQANGTGFGLAGAVWTSRTDCALRVARQLRAGTVWINCYKTLSVAVPFGGFGLSGWGRSSGTDVIAEYTNSRAVWLSEETYQGTFPSSHFV